MEHENQLKFNNKSLFYRELFTELNKTIHHDQLFITILKPGLSFYF